LHHYHIPKVLSGTHPVLQIPTLLESAFLEQTEARFVGSIDVGIELMNPQIIEAMFL
jgi:hypothetical protein